LEFSFLKRVVRDKDTENGAWNGAWNSILLGTYGVSNEGVVTAYLGCESSSMSKYGELSRWACSYGVSGTNIPKSVVGLGDVEMRLCAFSDRWGKIGALRNAYEVVQHQPCDR
jgi:hypothetical protein